MTARIVATAFRFRGPALVALLLFAAPPSVRPAIAQQEEERESSEQAAEAEPPPPRDNSEFIGVTTSAAVTRRFEMYNPHSQQGLRSLKDMGFTQVILDWPHLHPQATEIGLDVVLANWWTDKTPTDEIDRALELAQQVERGRLAGISIMDEPERNSPETPFGYYIELYESLRPRLDRELPGVPLEISHWGPLEIWDQRYYDYFSYLYEAADVMRIMPYPDLSEGPLGDVYLMMLRSREVMRIADRELPLVVILQTWVLPPRSELPEIAELRVMAWQAMLGGAQTVSFFDYNTDVWQQTPGFHDGFRDLMRELNDLSHRLRDATIESRMDDSGVLHATVRWPSDSTQSIRVNTNRTRVGELDALAIVESPAAGPMPMALPPCNDIGPKRIVSRRSRAGCVTAPRCIPRIPRRCAPQIHRRHRAFQRR